MLGRASCKEPQLQRPVKLAVTALQTLLKCFRIQAPDTSEIALHVPRADNSAADAAANHALDNGTFTDVRLHEIVTFLHCLGQHNPQGLGLMFSFDGAARGNPGAASYGLCLWWGRFQFGSFLANGLLVQKGQRLGTSTNNCAEALGLAAVIKLSLRYLLWVTEQLSQLALHPVTRESRIHELF